jgi:hypothetical protein
MFKILVFGLLLYIAWRLFGTQGLLSSGNRKPVSGPPKEEYTDYEEIER